MKQYFSIGLMSGTSMDGVDAALMRTDGEANVEVYAHKQLAYPGIFRHALKAAEYAIHYCDGDESRVEDCFSACLEEYFYQFSKEKCLTMLSRIADYFSAQHFKSITYQMVIEKSTDFHLTVIQKMLSDTAYSLIDIDFIGYHGQTLYHNPRTAKSLQVGNAQRIATTCDTDVIAQFRLNDIEHGGQGAPFAPIYHHVLAKKLGVLPLAIVNCGGIANITLAYDDNLIAFDTGPGNVLIDKWVAKNNLGTMDKNGQYGGCGQVIAELLNRLYSESALINGQNYYNMEPAKSLDSYDLSLIPNLGDYDFHDVCATLESFTAYTIVDSLKTIDSVVPLNWVLAGGGWKNPIIRRELKQYLSALNPSIVVSIADELGWDATCLEAEIFAYLAVRSHLDLAMTYPLTTGVSKPLTGGVCFKPAGKL